MRSSRVSFCFLALSFALTTAVGTASAAVVINEFKAKSTEWIELYNNGATDVDITGWTIGDADGGPAGGDVLNGILAAGAYLVVTPTNFGLSNTGDIIELRDNTTALVDDVGFGNDGGAPVCFNSTGRAPNGVDTDDWAADWNYLDDALDATPETPGAANKQPVANLGSSLIINEINRVRDAGTADSLQYIEIYNPTLAAVDLQNYWISDTDGFCQITNSIVVPAGGHAVLTEFVPGEGMDCPSFDAINFTLNDVAYLFLPNGVRIDQIGFDRGPDEGVGDTHQRCNDGQGPNNGFDYPSSGGGTTWRYLPSTPGSSNDAGCASPPPDPYDVARDPCVPVVNQPVTISVRALNTTAADLTYWVNGGMPTVVAMSMTGSSGDTTDWAANIPGQTGNEDLVEYTIDLFNAVPDTTTLFQRGYFVGLTQIATLRVNDSQGRNIYNNYGARVSGVVTAEYGLFQTTNTDYYVQDSTGGINVFKFGSHTVQPARGNAITVTGQLDQFNGKLEISEGGDCDSLFVELEGPGVLPNPLETPCSVLGEDVEGLLIKTRVLLVADTVGTQFLGDENYDMVQSGCADPVLRIDQNTNIPGVFISERIVDVVGIAGQYDLGAPYDAFYQIQPRDQSDITFIPPATGVEDDPGRFQMRLMQNAPNPWSRSTQIAFHVPGAPEGDAAAPVKLDVFDLQGRLVSTVVDQPMSPGEYRITLRRESLGNVKSGIYFYRFQAGDEVQTKKFMLIR